MLKLSEIASKSNGKLGIFDHGELDKIVAKWLRQRQTAGNGKIGAQIGILPFPIVGRCRNCPVTDSLSSPLLDVVTIEKMENLNGWTFLHFNLIQSGSSYSVLVQHHFSSSSIVSMHNISHFSSRFSFFFTKITLNIKEIKENRAVLQPMKTYENGNKLGGRLHSQKLFFPSMSCLICHSEE